jgi:hypothetical protein
MVDPRKHHFSPVFYLKGWCNADSDSKIIEYSRPHKKVVAKPVSPEATGFTRFLYTLEDAPDDQKQDIEKKYMSPFVDNRGAVALRILIERDGEKLTDDIRSDWTRFIMASQYRVPQKIANMTKELGKRLKNNVDSDPTLYADLQVTHSATPYEWIEKNHPNLVRDAATKAAIGSIESQRVGDIMVNMKWSTFDLRNSKHEMLTSDAPLLRTTGLIERNCLIAFPLSPRFLFVATHDRKVEATFLACGETAIVRWINDNIVRGAAHYVYGRTRSHLLFIEKRLCRPGTLGPIIPPYWLPSPR